MAESTCTSGKEIRVMNGVWDRTTPSSDASDAMLLAHGRDVLARESDAIASAAQHLDTSFCIAIRLLESCTGSIVVTGVGKAGLVARKISATLASTGTPSHFLHPTEAMHGDLGTLRRDDVLLALSQSGETEEITRLMPHVTAMGIRIIALTGRSDSTLARSADAVVCSGNVQEACLLGLAPTTSTSVLMALGDAMALVTSTLRNFTSEDFAKRHPGGNLGRQLGTVEQSMRPLSQCRVATVGDLVRTVFSKPLPSRRTGAVMVIEHDGRLAGIFTDSDLARLFERRLDELIDEPIECVMTRNPTVAGIGMRLRDVAALLASRRLSELPVVDADSRPVGLVDIVDLVGFVRPETIESSITDEMLSDTWTSEKVSEERNVDAAHDSSERAA